MQTARITLKNYRCFADAEPVRLEIGPGFTAFTGPNNSGKSSFLKLFHELRGLMAMLASPEGLVQLQSGRHFSAPLPAVEDPNEVFHNGNSRSLEFDVRIPPDGSPRATGFHFELSREPSPQARGHLLCDDSPIRDRNVQPANPPTFTLESGQREALELQPLVEVIAALNNAVYVGPFRNAINQGAGSYYDLAIGTTFIAQWDQWKTGASKQNAEMIQRITDDIARIFGFTKLEINASNDKTTFQVMIDGKPYRLRELGGGLAQFIVVFGNVATRKPSLILIDEPELNLHPSLQVEFLMSLASYASQGVVFATHSIGLARSIADRLYSFQKPGPSAIVRPFEQTPDLAEFLGEMSFSVFKELGHDAILLTEGVTEVRTVRQFLRTLRGDHKVVVIPLGGGQLIRQGVEQELADLRRLSSRVGVLIDSERSDAGAAVADSRSKFERECLQLKFDVHVTDLRAMENYFSERAIKVVMGPKYRALAPYEALRSADPAWGKHDNWRIAREMTSEELIQTDVGQFLNQFVNEPYTSKRSGSQAMPRALGGAM